MFLVVIHFLQEEKFAIAVYSVTRQQANVSLLRRPIFVPAENPWERNAKYLPAVAHATTAINAASIQRLWIVPQQLSVVNADRSTFWIPAIITAGSNHKTAAAHAREAQQTPQQPQASSLKGHSPADHHVRARQTAVHRQMAALPYAGMAYAKMRPVLPAKQFPAPIAIAASIITGVDNDAVPVWACVLPIKAHVHMSWGLPAAIPLPEHIAQVQQMDTRKKTAFRVIQVTVI